MGESTGRAWSAADRSALRAPGAAGPQVGVEAGLEAGDGRKVGPGGAIEDCGDGRVVDAGERFCRSKAAAVKRDPEAQGELSGDLGGKVIAGRFGPVGARGFRGRSSGASHDPTVDRSGPAVVVPANSVVTAPVQDGGSKQRLVVNGERAGAVAKRILNYTPQIPADHWAQIETFVRSAVADCFDDTPYSARVLLSVVSTYVHWCWQTAALPLERDLIFSRLRVEEFTVHSERRWSPVTRANHRSQLLRVCEALNGPDSGCRLSPLPKSDPQAPYTATEISSMRHWAQTQTTSTKRRDAAVLLALGLGAGLAAGEMGMVMTDDVHHDEYGVLVEVGGKRPRSVPVRAEWETTLVDAVDALGSGRLLFRTNRTGPSRNLVTDFTAKCSPHVPGVSSQRLRGTWITGHLAARTPVVPLIEAAGVTSLEAITRYLRFLPEVDPVEARARLRGDLRDGQRTEP
jgi:hypothetical protein